MPAQAPAPTFTTARQLSALGNAIHARRKALGVNATHVAEAAGMSRVTLHRVERGEPSVTMGAYLNAAEALGLALTLLPQAASGQTPLAHAEMQRTATPPGRIRIADFAELKLLAWHIPGAAELTPEEAFGLYERNWRHVAQDRLQPEERALIEQLRQRLGRGQILE